MKNKSKKLSANEINRFLYCPYQWYYGRYYGQTVLKEKYKAIHKNKSKQDANFTKGLKFHARYYRMYRLKRLFKKIVFILLGLTLIGGLIKWFFY